MLTYFGVVLANLELFEGLYEFGVNFIVNLLPISLQVLLDLRALLDLEGLDLLLLKFLQ